MEKLNELVELAKKATSGEWNAFISAGGDGTFSIHTLDDSRKGNVVNWPGFDTANCSKAQKKANAKYIAAAHPDTILAIAEAFRALEQRAEAAEARAANLNDGWLNAISERDEARAKLAELEKQEPAFLLNVDSRDSEQYQFDIRVKLSDGIHELFTRPAPAASLAELVPPQVSIRQAIAALENHEWCNTPASGYKAGVKDTISAMLRNIEQQK